jgi:hypothetical protein
MNGKMLTRTPDPDALLLAVDLERLDVAATILRVIVAV